jgi:quercetin dioxygenase-like cupin family protein
VPDYVHFHKIRFQLIFVKSGWVRVAYEGQGEPFVLQRGDCVIQPPEIRHRVLESSPGLEVIEIGCPAEHETIADWSMTLPTPVGDPARTWDGQRMVRHVAEGATYHRWRIDGWEHRDSGIGAATDGLAGVRVARPSGTVADSWIAHATEFALLVVLSGSVTFEAAGGDAIRLVDGASVAIPGGVRYRLTQPDQQCELLDVTMPAAFDVTVERA